MLFNSFEFFAFFLVFLVLFFASSRRLQPIVLLLASYVFYMGWRPTFAILLAFTTVVDFVTARVMQDSQSERVRKAAMVVALTINLGILASVKYLDFLISNVVGLAGFFGYDIPSYALGLVLPVGISFYTFQSVGYTLDVYNRRIPAESSFLNYAQYVSFFPQLVAGPIERAGHMLPQYRKQHFLRYDNLISGGWLIGYGLLKKMCVADAIAPFVSGVYSNPQAYNGSYQLIAMFLFGVQVYCDFSGYSDIARGTARILDCELMVNFRRPYFSATLTEFWRRWHISLSTWFRDFVYKPLGGSKQDPYVVTRNIMIVFLVSGFWHGAAWTFVVWGGVHGIGLIIERWFRETAWKRKLQDIAPGFVHLLSRGWTLAIVFCAMVFFRSNSLPDALETFRSFVHPGPLTYSVFNSLGLSAFHLAGLILSMLILLVVDLGLEKHPERLLKLSAVRPFNILIGVTMVYYIFFFGVFGRTDFIYFQF
jgi:D-alanyl-lipoteichoic acid acyltransferase DltB (MBOAT superfamily)